MSEDAWGRRYPGSRWWKFDFHNHTPASSDYEAVEARTLTPEQWLLAYMRAKVDCVTVTDHNTGDWIDRLQHALNGLESDLHVEFRPLTIFPGVEVTSNDSLHILGVFPPGSGKAKIDALMGGRLQITNPHAPTAERMCAQSASDVVEAIHALGGLAIAAHVERDNGLLRGTVDAAGVFSSALAGRTLDDVLRKLDAVEFQTLTNPSYTHFADRLKGVACVAGSDFPHHTSNAGTRTTWVKMSQPSFEGLRLALLDSEGAIRRGELSPEDPQNLPTLWIESVRLHDLHLKRAGGGDLSQSLHPAYNALIGGRGSGKSTVVEAIRLAMARDSEVSEDLLGTSSPIAQTFGRFRGSYDPARKLGMILPGSQLEVVFHQGTGEAALCYRCIWQRQADSRYWATADRLEGELWLPTNLSPDQIRAQFPTRIFSQKQILELAEQPQALLKFIDDAIHTDKRAWQETFEARRQALLAARLKVRALKAEIRNRPELEKQFTEANRKARVFSAGNFGPLLKAYQRASQQRRAIGDFLELIGKDLSLLRASLENAQSIAQTELSGFEAETPAEQAAVADALRLRNSLADQVRAIAAPVSAMEQELTAGTAGLNQSAWHNESQQHLAAYAAETARLKAAGIQSAQEAAAAVAAADQLGKQLEKIRASERQLVEAEQAVEQAAADLVASREELTALRAAFVQQLVAQNSLLHLNIRGMAHGPTALTDLRQRLGLAENAQFSDLWEETTDAQGRPVFKGLIWELVRPDRDTVISVSERLADLKRSVVARQNPVLGVRLEARLMKNIERLTDEALDALATWFPEDEITLKYQSRPGNNLRDIQAASAGQKTAAMLSFLLLHGDEPLVLDQPEDDLDNALVSELVVSQLRSNKKRRQLIVVTHNANIVVNGDAELVLTMDFAGGSIQCNRSGGLQEKSVREDICRVMEGGREAFEKRYQRILQHLDKLP